MRNIVWRKTGGGIAITNVLADGITSQGEADRLKNNGVIPPGWEILAFDIEIPSDRYFRDAWAHDGESIVVDIEKAKEIKKNELRRLRKHLLEKLDVDFMVALERGDSAKAAEVSAKKQELRDITSAAGIEEAKTAEELKAFIPTALGGV